MPSLNVLSIVYAARRDDGYVASDIKRYRDRCTQRVASYRRIIGVKGLFYKSCSDLPDGFDVTLHSESLLLLVLFEAERAFGEAMLSNQAIHIDSLYGKMRRRMFTRLQRAVERAKVVEELGKQGYGLHLSCLFYASYMRAILAHEKEDFTAAASDFGVCMAILKKMWSQPNADETSLQFFVNDIEKRYNYCLYMVSAFVTDPTVIQLLESERNQVIAEVLDAALELHKFNSDPDSLYGPTMELQLLFGKSSLPLPQGSVLKRFTVLLETRPTNMDSGAAVHELLTAYEILYGCAIRYYFNTDGNTDEIRAALAESVSLVKAKGLRLSTHKVWISRMRSLCKFYTGKNSSFDKSRLEAILAALDLEERALRLVSGLTMIIFRFLYLLDENFLRDTDTLPIISLKTTPLKGKGSLELTVNTISALEDMRAPTHRAINSLPFGKDPLLDLLLSLHSFESALFLCHRADMPDNNINLRKNLLQQARTRFTKLIDATSAIEPNSFDLKIPKLGETFPELTSLLTSVIKNEKLFKVLHTLSTNQLIVTITKSQKKADLTVFRLCGLLPPPYTEDAVPVFLTTDFITQPIPKTHDKSNSKDNEVVESAAPRKKRFFGLFQY